MTKENTYLFTFVDINFDKNQRQKIALMIIF